MLDLVWGDEIAQRIRLEDLRRLCPCAVCEGTRAKQESSELHVISSAELSASASVVNLTPVGRFAIQIRWSDGHDTGIYTYDYLRSMGTTAS